MHKSRTVSVDQSLTRMARRLLRVQDRRLQRRLRRCARHPERPERVHQLRIATRRVDAALSTLAPLLPPRRSRRLLRTIRQVRRAARSVRDLDVLIARMTDADLTEIAATLQHLRPLAAKDLVGAIRNVTESGVERRLNQIRKRVRWCDGEPPTGVDQLVRVLLKPTLQRFQLASEQDLAQIEQLHRFRLHGKRVRYSLELLEDLCGDDHVRSLKQLTQRLQKELGDINDHATAIEILSRLDDCAAQELLAAERRQLGEEHAAFLEWWGSSGRGETAAVIADVLAGDGERR